MRRIWNGYMELNRRADDPKSHMGWDALWAAVHGFGAFVVVFGFIALTVETNGIALLLIPVTLLGLFWGLGK